MRVLGDYRDDKDVLVATERGVVRIGAIDADRAWGSRRAIRVRDAAGPLKDHVYELAPEEASGVPPAEDPIRVPPYRPAWRLGDEAFAMPEGSGTPIRGRISSMRIADGLPSSVVLETADGRYVPDIPVSALSKDVKYDQAAKAGKE